MTANGFTTQMEKPIAILGTLILIVNSYVMCNNMVSIAIGMK